VLNKSPEITKIYGTNSLVHHEAVPKYAKLPARELCFDLHVPLALGNPLLRLVTKAFLVPVKLHALAALVLGDLCFAFLFD